MMTESCDTLRLKVTGECNRRCSFCHEEGGMEGIQEMRPDAALFGAVSTLSEALGIGAASITGGEPLLHSDLVSLVEGLSANSPVGRFSLTTNGTILEEYEFWGRLRDAGLERVNISMPDLLEYSSLGGGGRWPDVLPEGVATVFDNQVSTMRLLRKLGVSVDVNMVVFNDYHNTGNMLRKLLLLKREGLDYRIMLLPNLLDRESYRSSLEVIERIKRESGFRRVSAKRRERSSGGVESYETNGVEVFVKSTMLDASGGRRASGPFCLESLRSGCRVRKGGECLEGFYGIRLEVRGGDVLVRLCVHGGTDAPILMGFDEFLRSAPFRELRSEAVSSGGAE